MGCYSFKIYSNFIPTSGQCSFSITLKYLSGFLKLISENILWNTESALWMQNDNDDDDDDNVHGYDNNDDDLSKLLRQRC